MLTIVTRCIGPHSNKYYTSDKIKPSNNVRMVLSMNTTVNVN